MARNQLSNRQFDGIVLLGGYDVVPAAVQDVLPRDLRNQVAHNGDPDNFIVWSDHQYGDLDGDGVADLPLSRIPDGKSSELIKRCLDSRATSASQSRHGIRNIQRPFADGVFDILTGDEKMLTSRPTVHTEVPSVTHDYVYLMLHGSYSECNRISRGADQWPSSIQSRATYRTLHRRLSSLVVVGEL